MVSREGRCTTPADEATSREAEENRVADPMTQEGRWNMLDEREQREAASIDATLPMRATTPPVSGAAVATQSYYDTRWPLVNRLLALTDTITRGRAGVLQRLFTYLLIGGTAALVNLGSFAILFHFGSPKNVAYYWFANVVAYEVSILANFIPNDYFTFSHLAGHNRSWLARCLRFHITSLSGVLVTILISTSLFHFTGWPYLICQAIALIIAVFYNFTVHHLFTYAHKKA